MKPKILIVDDDPLMHRLYKKYLEDAGYKMLIAENGTEAMAVVAQEQPQLIIMDIMMPGRDGLSVLRELKGLEISKDIPVVIVTANLDHYRTAKNESGNSGAESFLPKPLSPARLLAEVKRVLSLPCPVAA